MVWPVWVPFYPLIHVTDLHEVGIEPSRVEQGLGTKHLGTGSDEPFEAVSQLEWLVSLHIGSARMNRKLTLVQTCTTTHFTYMPPKNFRNTIPRFLTCLKYEPLENFVQDWLIEEHAVALDKIRSGSVT
jgi:hypothetical protein